MPYRLMDLGAGATASIVAMMGGAHTLVVGVTEFSGTEQFVLGLVKEGGAWAVVALLIYFYRRDWMRLADQTKPLLEIAQHSTQAQERTAAALENNTDVLKDLVGELRATRKARE